MIDLGLSNDAFLSQHYDRKPLIVRQAYSGTGINWDSINEAVFIGEREDGYIRIHKDGFVEPDRYSELCSDIGIVRRRIVRPALRALLEQGASMVFNRLDMFSYPVREICDVFSRITGANTSANGYVAFRDKESFGKHWDTHDVFAVQLIGRKRWLVYEPTFPQPISGQTSLRHKAACPHTPIIDTVLAKGDVLYLPRGWWHTAVPLQEETCHIAVGVHRPSLIDYLQWVIDTEAPGAVELRQPIPLNAGDGGAFEAAKSAFSSLAFSQDTLQAYHKHTAGNARSASLLDLAHGFTDNAINLRDSCFSVTARLHPSEIQREMQINGAELTLNDDACAILRALSTRPSPLSFDNLHAAVPHMTPPQLQFRLWPLVAQDVVSLHRHDI